jgi:hypothetical protein
MGWACQKRLKREFGGCDRDGWDSSLGPCFASGGGLDNGGAGEAVDWRLDMKLGFGASGGGVPLCQSSILCAMERLEQEHRRLG